MDGLPNLKNSFPKLGGHALNESPFFRARRRHFSLSPRNFWCPRRSAAGPLHPTPGELWPSPFRGWPNFVCRRIVREHPSARFYEQVCVVAAFPLRRRVPTALTFSFLFNCRNPPSKHRRAKPLDATAFERKPRLAKTYPLPLHLLGHLLENLFLARLLRSLPPPRRIL
ncbi:hypothetical protein TRVL_09278 [Trypanosoma vivax]|nr:hypothetical protein TRVL_09278 [Trypanosoma vivax]